MRSRADAGEDAAATLYEEHAGRLFGLAYRMLGSVQEAQDAVQDTFVRWASADAADVREPAAWLTTALTRICLDQLKSARRQRETYVGPWLPEPLATESVDPADLAGTADSLTFAFLVVLESLSPLERAVFVLHDVFGYPYPDVARMVGRSAAAVRQHGARARRSMQTRQQRYDVDAGRDRAVLEAFLTACAGGDLDTMLGLLAPGVQFVGDGGGVASAVRRPVEGAQRVAQLFLGFWRLGAQQGLSARLVEVNYRPALQVMTAAADTDSVMCFEISEGRISAVRAVRNPAKLTGFAQLTRPVQS